MIRAIIFDYYGVIRPDLTTYHVHHDPALLSFIAELRGRGYKIGLLSNVGPGRLAEFFTPEELARYFDVALSSGDIGVAKPEPEAYIAIAEKLGVTPESCVMIDDQPVHCVGARTSGMQAILYEGMPQLKQVLDELLEPLSKTSR